MLTGDFAPIMFKQERIGRYGKPFKLYKFRTMIVNADEVLFKAGINPLRKPASLNDLECENIILASKSILEKASI